MPEGVEDIRPGGSTQRFKVLIILLYVAEAGFPHSLRALFCPILARHVCQSCVYGDHAERFVELVWFVYCPLALAFSLTPADSLATLRAQALCEVINHKDLKPPHPYYVVPHEDWVMTRYFFVINGAAASQHGLQSNTLAFEKRLPKLLESSPDGSTSAASLGEASSSGAATAADAAASTDFLAAATFQGKKAGIGMLHRAGVCVLFIA
jgi:hypothetical protein